MSVSKSDWQSWAETMWAPAYSACSDAFDMLSEANEIMFVSQERWLELRERCSPDGPVHEAIDMAESLLLGAKDRFESNLLLQGAQRKFAANSVIAIVDAIAKGLKELYLGFVTNESDRNAVFGRCGGATPDEEWLNNVAPALRDQEFIKLGGLRSDWVDFADQLNDLVTELTQVQHISMFKQ